MGSLPIELIVYILHYVDLKTLLTCQQVCVTNYPMFTFKF